MKNKTKIIKNKIAMYGGTFDPIHLGHLHVIKNVVTYTDYNYILCIPTNHNPLKKVNPIASPSQRLTMIKLAIADLSFVDVLSYEIEKTEEAYSIDTIRYLKKNYFIKDSLGFIVGEDVLEQLTQWKNINEIKNNVEFIIIPRNHTHDTTTNNGNSVERPDPSIYLKDYKYLYLLNVKPLDINSTNIRQDKETHRDHLPQVVFDYIQSEALYP